MLVLFLSAVSLSHYASTCVLSICGSDTTDTAPKQCDMDTFTTLTVLFLFVIGSQAQNSK